MLDCRKAERVVDGENRRVPVKRRGRRWHSSSVQVCKTLSRRVGARVKRVNEQGVNRTNTGVDPITEQPIITIKKEQKIPKTQSALHVILLRLEPALVTNNKQLLEPILKTELNLR